jgi:hypothetical protein
VGNVGCVADERAGVDATLHAADDELPHGAAGLAFGGPGSKSVKRRRNISSASTGFARMNARNACIARARSPRGSSVSAIPSKSRRSIRKPSKKISRTSPALSPNSSYTAGVEVSACSATLRVVSCAAPSRASSATATRSTRSRSSGVRCLARGTRA